MTPFLFKKQKVFFTIGLLFSLLFFVWIPVRASDEPLQAGRFVKRIILDDEGLMFEIKTEAATVNDFLEEHHIQVSQEDRVFPDVQKTLYPGMRVLIQRAKHITLTMENGRRDILTYQRSLNGVFAENDILLGENDMITPGEDESAFDGMKVSIIRVRKEEQVIHKVIPYEKQVSENVEMSWRKSTVTQKGENGVQEFTYLVSLHDGKEVSRKLIKKEVTKESIPEKIIQGTFVKTGKSHTGLGTWYAYTGTMAAASPWLPMGSYVKVTNQENGKSVIVKINDRGPFGKNRILDLDKVAFQKIASLGAGVINLKVEEITN